MCGIAGIFVPGQTPDRPAYLDATRRMTSLLSRRGPDDEGFWADPFDRLFLGFRRLAVMDTSEAGHQPMVSGDERSVIVFNGEIYNHRELRHSLTNCGVRFRSRTDTEVLLEALNQWGTSAIQRLNGMFAFAWHDNREGKLVLARDHAGIKPLYYFLDPAGKGLAFASQFNALLNTPWGEPGQVQQDVLRLYLRLHYIPAPYGLLGNTHQLEPGHLLSVGRDGVIKKQGWWTLPRDPEPELKGSKAVDAVAEAADRVVRRQLVADVPLGVFLSGGVDSPLVTAVARQQMGPDLKAFTIGNPGWCQDESDPAATYARHIDVDHWVRHVHGDDALSTIRDVIGAQHEPFADFSVLPTLLVSRFARSKVTVALSGDGGDELFFGYERPVSLLKNGSDFRWPWPARVALYAAGRYGLRTPTSDVVVFRTPGHYYFEVNSRLKEGDLRSLAPGLPPTPGDFRLYAFDGYKDLRHLANYSRCVEYYGQLQRCLKKVDMASMHNSLEVRVPLLDKEMIDVSLRIDPFDNIHNGTRKAVLRKLLAQYVPAEVIPKPKRGFSVPLGAWLRGPLRALVEETLFDGPLYPDGVFERKRLMEYWKSHLSGERDLKWGLWTLLTLQWWAQTHARNRHAEHV